MFIDPYQFSFTKKLEDNIEIFLKLIRIHDDRFIDPRDNFPDEEDHPANLIVRGAHWDALPLIAHNEDESIYTEENLKGIKHWDRYYKRTTTENDYSEAVSFIKTNVPNYSTTAIVNMAAHTRLRPHVGIPGAFLRMHIGLIVPEGDIGIQVEKEKRKWEVGKALCFNDRLLHRAWNNSDEDRYILSVDFKPDGDYNG